MPDKKIVPFDQRPRAVRADGNKVSLKACAELAAAEAGFQVELAQLNSGFEMTFTWPTGRLPVDQIDGVLVVHDGGYPFLVPFYRGSLGVVPLHSPYIPSGLGKFLQNESKCLQPPLPCLRQRLVVRWGRSRRRAFLGGRRRNIGVSWASCVAPTSSSGSHML